MKIYTFNAPENTRVEILWTLRPRNRDKIFAAFINQARYTEVNSIKDCDLAIYPEKVFNPETLNFDSSVYAAVEKAQQYNKPLILDATSDADAFLDTPSAQILRCGLYKSLKQPFETECPFWSNYRTKHNLDLLPIVPKGSRPAVGFCGTTSSIGKLARIVKCTAPNRLAQSLLSQGKFARQLEARLKEGISLKLRASAIDILSADQRINSCFDISNPRQSYYLDNDANRVMLEKLFINNMNKCDYTLCIRGTGNYSGRFYMALNAGRIPVVLDTDVVIPFEERLHIVKVPAQSLANISDFILEHFEGTSEQDLREMKAENRFVYNQFIAPEKFLPDFLNSIIPSPVSSVNSYSKSINVGTA